MTIGKLLIVASFACVLVVACNGESDRATTIQPTETSSQQTPASDETATTVETAGPSPTASEDQIAERLGGALLTIEDMPTGWTVSPADEDDDDETPICGIESGAFGDEALDRLTANFQQSELGPFLAQIIDRFAEGEAKGIMTEFGDAFGSCTEFVDVDEDGEETSWRLSPLSFPNIGDETFAFRMSTTVAILGFVELDFVVWRRGDVVEVIGHVSTGFEGIDSEQTESFVRRADDKLREILE